MTCASIAHSSHTHAIQTSKCIHACMWHVFTCSNQSHAHAWRQRAYRQWRDLSMSSTHFSEEPRIATTWGLCSRTLPLPPKKKKTTARIPTQRRRMISSVNQEHCLGFPHIRATSTWTSGQTLNFSSLPAISCQIRTPCLIDLFSQQNPEETNLAPGPATWLHIADMTHLNRGAARPIKLTKPLSTCQIMRMCPNWPILKNVLEFQGYFKKRTFPKKALQRPQKDTFMCTIGRSRNKHFQFYCVSETGQIPF